MKKLIFLLFILQLANIGSASEHADTLRVAEATRDCHYYSGGFSTGAGTPKTVNAGDVLSDTAKRYTLYLSVQDTTSAKVSEIDSVKVRFYNGIARTSGAVAFSIKLADGATAPAIADSNTFKTELADSTTNNIYWSVTQAFGADTWFLTPDISTPYKEWRGSYAFAKNDYAGIFVQDIASAAGKYISPYAYEQGSNPMEVIIYWQDTAKSDATRAKGQRFPSANMTDGRIY